MFTYTEIFEPKSSILIVTAHPDDCLVYFAALINKLRKDNKNVSVLVVTNGARGSKENIISEEELAKQRITEEISALEYLKVPKANFFCLDYKDGEVESDMKLIGEVSYYIRKFKADIVCTHEPGLIYESTYDNTGFFVQHRDHRKVGEAVIDAAYPFARDRSFFPEHQKEGIEPHSVYELLLTDEKGSNFHFDYTSELETKKTAMRYHKSQFDEDFITQVVDDMKKDDHYFEMFKYIKLLW
jgi:LmbE family N-acetylglucosaminyl deacetylase